MASIEVELSKLVLSLFNNGPQSGNCKSPVPCILKRLARQWHLTRAIEWPRPAVIAQNMERLRDGGKLAREILGLRDFIFSDPLELNSS